MRERLRLFVAVDLPPEVRDALAAWAESAAPPAMRRVPAENLHLTLAFLGSRSNENVNAVAALLPDLAAPVGLLRTEGALWLPPRRPGVLSVALGASDGLVALHAAVVSALRDAVGYEPDHPRFRPHVTVGRVRRGATMRGAELPPPPAVFFAAEALTLYSSVTGPGGSVYAPLARVALGGGAGPGEQHR
ncbi:MAG: 2,3-cyclic 3-phosphodiesterase [Solirubrobacteraceae bacterium]|jgi:2'-5' RNA ligase|nr:2,3-cyclic 3-phosphodiesterase [Solirubrobacteraceae bacterium]